MQHLENEEEVAIWLSQFNLSGIKEEVGYLLDACSSDILKMSRVFICAARAMVIINEKKNQELLDDVGRLLRS